VRFFAIAALCLLPGCATIINGTTDVVSVTSTPPGAACTVDRVTTGAQNERIAEIQQTPGTVSIGKSRRDLLVSCSKEGYTPVAQVIEPSFSGTTFFNLLLGGVVGFIVDASTGANNRYPGNVPVTLSTTPMPPPAPLQPLAGLSQTGV
jgi:hypothetical protein